MWRLELRIPEISGIPMISFTSCAGLDFVPDVQDSDLFIVYDKH
jgi:hypothetical protein